MHQLSTLRRLAVAGTLALVGLAAASAPAQAGLLVESAGPCGDQPISKPFARWLDMADYTPAPDGTLERGAAGWTLAGGAKVVDGNEPFYISGSRSDSRSLALPARSSARTPVMCVGLEHPTLRLVARSNASLLSTLTSALKVDAIVETSLGTAVTVPVGVVALSPSWAPSLPMPIAASLLPLLPGEHTPVAFQLTPVGGAGWQVDDIYVDPKMRG